MKIVIQNFNTVTNSQSSYIDACLKQIGIQSILWDSNIHSLYDIMDLSQADIVFVHWESKFLKDACKYTSGTDKDIIVNITNAPQEIVSQLDNVKNCKLLINNSILMTPYKTNKKLRTIYPGADLFIPKTQSISYQVEALLCSNNDSELLNKESEKYQCYHKFLFAEKQNENFDANVNIYNAVNLYRNYQKVILCGDLDFVFSQVFFDAILNCQKVMIRSEDKEAARKILIELFYTLSEVEEEQIPFAIRKGTMENHTCFHRTAELLSLLNCNQEASSLLKIIKND